MAFSVTTGRSAASPDATPAARSSRVSAETSSASARALMTVMDGSASPCSIWLRYGLEMRASSAACRRLSWAS